MRAKGVPFGLWGTVVATHSHSSCVEVVFDEEFIGGTTLHGMCSNYRYGQKLFRKTFFEKGGSCFVIFFFLFSFSPGYILQTISIL